MNVENDLLFEKRKDFLKNSMTKCTSCKTSLVVGKMRCPACGTWNTGSRPTEAPDGAETDGTVVLAKVTSADATRVCVGQFNPIWGGGIVATSTTLLGGEPGAGKSTAVLQILDTILEGLPVREAIYVAAEECLPEIRLRADRLEVANQDRIRMIAAMKGADNLGEIFVARNPCAIVLDSLQGLAANVPTVQLQLCEIAKEYAASLECPVILISRVNKGGDLSGINDLQHAVDTCLLLSVVEGDIREWYVKKNRFGRNATLHFDMTQNGLKLIPEQSED